MRKLTEERLAIHACVKYVIINCTFLPFCPFWRENVAVNQMLSLNKSDGFQSSKRQVVGHLEAGIVT